MSHYAAYRHLPDDVLAFTIRKLARQVEALSYATTDTARRVQDSYRAALDEALREQERRATP